MKNKTLIKNIFLKNKNTFLISESRKIFPHIKESFIQQNKQLLFNLIQAYKQTKRNYHIFSLNENINRKRFYKEALLINYYKFVLQESTSVEHFAQRLDETYFELFKKHNTFKQKLLKEYHNYKLKTKNVILEKEGRPQFDPQQDLDHKNPDDKNPETVAYWKKVAEQEPKAEDVQPFIKYMKYYEKGYNPFKIYSIPEGEPGGDKMYKPAIQQKLYYRYILKKKLQKKKLSDEDIQQKLQKFDKDNELTQYTQGESEEPKEEKKQGFFSRLLSKAKNAIGGVVGFIFDSPEEKKQVEKVSKEVPQQKQKSWYQKIKEIIGKIIDLYNDPKWKPVFQGAFRAIAYMVIMWVLGVIAASLGPWGVLLISIVKAVLSLFTIFKGAKELYKKFGELSEGKTGIKGLINIAKNIIKPANLLFVIIRVITIVMAVWGLVSALQSAYKAAQDILKSMGYTTDQIQAAAEGDPPKDTAQQQGQQPETQGNNLSPEVKEQLYKGVNLDESPKLNLSGNTPEEQIQSAIKAIHSNRDLARDIQMIGRNVARNNLSNDAIEKASKALFYKYFGDNVDPELLLSPASSVGYTKFSGTVKDLLTSFLENGIESVQLDYM